MVQNSGHTKMCVCVWLGGVFEDTRLHMHGCRAAASLVFQRKRSCC